MSGTALSIDCVAPMWKWRGMPGRRAVVLRRSDDDGVELERLIHLHKLRVVFTAVTDSAVPRLVVMIAAGHAFEHRAEVVVVPHLTAEDVWAAREWHALAEIADVLGADVILESGAVLPRQALN
ncbi:MULTISPECIES: hypothetical protein [Nocardia]|uniref:hypothetical protein n=1 Tax=Nocardia TaxID=1817 RepID=UPI0018957E51|nr:MULTISPECIES: hypothetical protein [Nocardia]MBF6350324.1 hypothetical protein [Nocardia flavorosea]